MAILSIPGHARAGIGAFQSIQLPRELLRPHDRQRTNPTSLSPEEILHGLGIPGASELDLQHDFPHARLHLDREAGLLRRRGKRDVQSILRADTYLPHESTAEFPRQ